MRFSRTNMRLAAARCRSLSKKIGVQTAEFSITAFCWRNADSRKSRTYERHNAEIRLELFNLSHTAARLQPGSDTRGGALALAAGGCHRSPLPCQRRRPHPAGGGLRGAPEPRALRHRRPPLGQRPPRSRRGETALLKVDVV